MLAFLRSWRAGRSGAWAATRACGVTIASVWLLSSCAATSAQAPIPCSDLKYGSPKYHDKMDELAKRAKLPHNSWTRYHEDVVRNLCNGTLKDVDQLVSDNVVKASEAQAIAKVIGKTYTPKQTQQTATSYASLKTKFVEMGACNACADNIAQHVSKTPDSACGKLAEQALSGDAEAVNKLVAFPDYCKWKY